MRQMKLVGLIRKLVRKATGLVKFGRHDTHQKDEHTHCRAWMYGIGSFGGNGSLYVAGRRWAGMLIWREGRYAPETVAWCAFMEIVGFYAGIHRINGESHNWIFLDVQIESKDG